MYRILCLFVLALVWLAQVAPPIQAKVHTMPVAYQDGDTELEGYLAYDDKVEGARPAVLVIPEWWGLNDYAKKRAEMLAELGYVGFAVDMYGKGNVTKDPKQALQWANAIRSDKDKWLQRIEAGLAKAKEFKQVDAKRIAAIGYCLGGSTALQLALSGADVAAVISFHGALPGDITVAQAKAAKGSILICHGAADSFIKEETAQKFRAVLDEAGADYTFIYYGGAAHSFTNPDADAAKVPGLAYQKAADMRSWAHMRQLLEDKFEIGGEAAKAAKSARKAAAQILIEDVEVVEPDQSQPEYLARRWHFDLSGSPKIHLEKLTRRVA